MKFIDHNSDKPLYDQLCDLLKKKIDTDELKAGTLLPTERRLAVLYDVSRTTVRIALQNLELSGYVERIQGKGTFVSDKKDIFHCNNVESDFELRTRQIGKIPTIQLLQVKEVKKSNRNKRLNKFWHLSNCDKLICIQKLYLANKSPILLEDIYINYNKFSKFDLNGLDDNKVKRDISEKIDKSISYVQDQLQLSKVDKKAEDLLKINKNIPIIFIEHSCFDKNNNLVKLSIRRARADKYQYSVIYKI